MTRTERASYPRALMKDRSESRSGLDPNVRKAGGGQHNWGKIQDEYQIETMAEQEVRREEEEEGLVDVSPARARSRSPSSTEDSSKVPAGRARAASTDDDVEQALKLRKNLMKKPNVDLADIARTSAAVRGMSPPNRTTTSDEASPFIRLSNRPSNDVCVQTVPLF